MTSNPRTRMICLGDDATPPGARPESVALTSLAAAVRALYIRAYRAFTHNHQYGHGPIARWDGGEDAWGRSTKSIWPSIATKILSLGAEPDKYVQAQFWLDRGRRPPTPNQLLSDDAVARWRSFDGNSASRGDDLADQLRRERLSVTATSMAYTQGAGWPPVRALRYALINESVVFASALLRYCLAIQNGLDDIAAAYYDKALLQYVVQAAAYDENWPGMIPAAMQQDARGVAHRITSG